MADDWESQLTPGHATPDDWENQLIVGHPDAPAKTGQPGDIGAGGTFLAHTARHLAFGLGDKVLAGVNAIDDKLHDKTGKVTLGDAYNRDLAFNDKAIDASDKLHPVERWAGNATGVIGSALAPLGLTRLSGLLRGASPAAEAAVSEAVPQLARKTLLWNAAKRGVEPGAAIGAAGSFGSDRSDSAEGTAANTLLGAASGSLLGLAAPYVAEGAGRLAGAAGGLLRKGASRLKVHSLEPVPTLGEKLADLPGGEDAAGRLLLDEGVGGFTRKGTAEQIAALGRKASGAAGSLAEDYDASGGPKLDVAPAVFRGANAASDLTDEPATRTAGRRLSGLVRQYAEKYNDGTASAADALTTKRALGEVAYGGKKLLGSGDTVGGKYGEGAGQMQRGFDDALDKGLGPKFEAANLRVRQLMGLEQAADRSASRGLRNHLVGGLGTMLAGGAGFAHGGAHEAIPVALGAFLLDRYGSQAGAYGLNKLGQGLELGSGVAGDAGAALARRAISPAEEKMQALIGALRNRQPAPMATNAVASEEPQQ